MTNRSRRKFMTAYASAVLALPLAAYARQQPVRLVVGYPPGGTLDFVARVISQPLGEALGTSVLVLNKAGANGLIGGEYVAHAPPDMATLWLTSVGAVAISPWLLAKMPFDPQHDLVPVSQVVRNVEVLLVNPKSPYNTAADLVAAARKGTKLAFASPGTGSISHLAIEQLNEVAKINILHVPYKGGGPATNDLMAGLVDGYFSDLAGVIGFIQSGRLKPIGITADHRHPLLPDVKTFNEMGMPGVDTENWNAIFAPKGSSAADVARVAAALRHVLTTQSVVAKLKTSGTEALPSSPAELGALLKKDTEKWGKLIKARDIKPQ